MKKYRQNELFFEELNEKSAYWLGFIAGDGTVCKRKYCCYLRISLCSVDAEHLNKFKKDIEYSGEVKSTITHNIVSEDNPLKKDKYYGSRISIYSKKIYESLQKYNIVQRKTYCYRIPDIIKNNENLRHFIRGCIDADGSIISRNNSNSLAISFCGFKGFVCDVYDAIRNNLNINSGSMSIKQKSKIYKSDFDTYQFEFSKITDVTKILEWLYKDATVYLDRKKETADKHDPFCKIPLDRFIISKEELKSIYNETKNIAEVSRKYKVSEKTIKRNLKNNLIEIIDDSNQYNDFFEQDTEISSYWFGFFAGKANVINNKYICLYIKEKEILDNFINDSKMKVNICKNNKDYYFITIYNNKMVNYFNENGFNVSNKESNYIIPERIYNSKNINHFIRGYVDARASTVGRLITISGCEIFLNQLNKCFKNITKVKSRNKCYSVFYKGKNDIKNVYNYIYKDANTYLESKYNKIKDLLI